MKKDNAHVKIFEAEVWNGNSKDFHSQNVDFYQISIFDLDMAVTLLGGFLC